MSRFDDYAQRFLAALYLETEESGRDYHTASKIHQKYALTPEKLWVGRMADEWEFRYFKDVSKVLGGYDAWSFRLSAEGYRKVEQDFRDHDDVRRFLGIVEEDSFETISRKLLPASDRLVTLGDNSDLSRTLLHGVEEIEQKIVSSNLLPTDEKSDVIESLSAFKNLVDRSKTLIVGAFRYLVLERLKKAFEKIIEDAFRLAILTVLAGLVLTILAVL